MFSRSTELDIQFGDCDPAGIVYYPNYFRYFDNATAALVSMALGMNKPAWLAEFSIAGIPMVDTGARFLRPSRFGDSVRIESRFGELGRSSFAVQHKLFNGENLAVEAHEKRVWAVRDASGGIRGESLPDAVRRAFEAA